MSQAPIRRSFMQCQDQPYLACAKRVLAAAVLAAGMAMLASCGSGSGTQQPGTPPIQRRGALQVTTSPALSPAFDPTISDYVFVYKPGLPVQVSVAAPTNTTVAVDGKPARALNSASQVNVTPGQGFSFVVNSAGSSKTYFVRRLPADFPVWTTERSGTPQAEYYVVAPNNSLTPGTPGSYVILSDGYGVPMWWYRGAELPLDAKLFPNGNIAWTGTTKAEEHKLDGSLVHTVTPAGIPAATLDNHEVLLLPNGDYLFMADVRRFPVDLSSFGGAANAIVLDTVAAESAPDGTVVWQWSAMDHIPVSETDPLWRPQSLAKASPADPYHMNSIEPDGDGFVVSLRQLNAVIRIDKASGNIVWKLGGTPRPESLAFVGDAYGNFGGQHDARVQVDGTLTVHDNGTLQGRAPRAVRYRIDAAARTATFIEQVTDPDVSSSICCGSARKLGGGDWVMSWGSNAFVTELTPAGKRVFRMTFQAPWFSYRGLPIPFGTLDRAALRKGMDAQFPR